MSTGVRRLPEHLVRIYPNEVFAAPRATSIDLPTNVNTCHILTAAYRVEQPLAHKDTVQHRTSESIQTGVL